MGGFQDRLYCLLDTRASVGVAAEGLEWRGGEGMCCSCWGKPARNLIPEPVWTKRRRVSETLLPGRQNVCASCMPTTPSMS